MPNDDFLRLFSVLAALLCGTANLVGQGTAADYQRAQVLRSQSSHQVFRDQLEVTWHPSSTHFIYRVAISAQEHHFYHVDARTGKKRPAFDHQMMASRISELSGRKVGAANLPIQRIAWPLDGEGLILTIEDADWHFDFQQQTLQKETRATVTEVVARRISKVRRSVFGGASSTLRFINVLESEVQILWVEDAPGWKIVTRDRGRLSPHSEVTFSTKAGHIWIVVDDKEMPVAVFEAVAGKSLARIERRQEKIQWESSKVSPDGKWLLPANSIDVRVRRLGSEDQIQFANAGTPEFFFGWGQYWAPDSQKLVVLQSKLGADRKIHLVESAPPDQLQPKLHARHYTKPGDDQPQSFPKLFDVEKGREVEITNPDLFAHPWEISRYRWLPDSSRFMFLYNERGHQTMRLISVDANTGEARCILEETSDTFIDYQHKFFLHYTEAADEVLWLSQRDGWNHLYLCDTNRGTSKQVTRGHWVVRGVDRVDEGLRKIWFRASGIFPDQDPYYVHHCHVNFDGTGLVVMTRGDGTHQVHYSPDRRYLIDTYSRVDLPPVTELRVVEKGTLVCELERADWSALRATGWKAPERFVAPGRDGITPIYGLVFLPSNFDKDRQYPVIESIYAGPHNSFVPKAFSSFHSEQAEAELGFIVVKIDGMGTSNRSKAFHDVCWKNLGDSGFPDRIRWIQAAAKEYPQMDLRRIGIYGYSSGGQSALRALLAFGDFYHVAVSDCGCHDNRMDKTWWNELWMGYPVGHHYAEQSNVTNAHKLRGKLLLTVGELDDNVDPSSTMQVVDALIKADKDFDLVVFPGGKHGAGTFSPYGVRRRRDFFVRHLLGVEPRADMSP